MVGIEAIVGSVVGREEVIGSGQALPATAPRRQKNLIARVLRSAHNSRTVGSVVGIRGDSRVGK